MTGTISLHNQGLWQPRQNNQIAFCGKGREGLRYVSRQITDTFDKGCLPGVTAAVLTASSGGTTGQAILNGLTVAFASKVGQDFRQCWQYGKKLRGTNLFKNNLFKRFYNMK